MLSRFVLQDYTSHSVFSFKLLEDACHKLDLAVEFRDSQPGASYDCYFTALKQQTHLRETEDRLKSQIDGMEQLVTSAVIAFPGATAQPAYQQCAMNYMREERD